MTTKLKLNAVLMISTVITTCCLKPSLQTNVCIEGDIRLVGGDRKTEGNVEYCYDNTWGRICRRDFELNDAVVICRQLGFADNATGVQPIYYPAFGVAPDSVPIWIDRLGCFGYESRVMDCPTIASVYQTGVQLNEDCDHAHETIAVNCATVTADQVCTDGDIRLVGGDQKSEGNVEYCYRNTWGRVCRRDFDLNDAVVICRELGFADNATGVLPIHYPAFGVAPNSVPIWLDRLGCSGYESRLVDCYRYQTGVTLNLDCDHSLETVAVSCDQACNDGDVRLYGGYIRYEGVVEVCISNVWGSVCDDGWDYNDASVVCRQLGFLDYGAIALEYDAWFILRPNEAQIKIWLDELACSGNETNLIECPANEPGNHDCQHWEDAKVQCIDPSILDSRQEQVGCSHGTIRLVGGTDEFSGYVELCVNNVWGMVCNHDWDEENTAVVCRQLGFSGSEYFDYPHHAFGPKYEPIWLDHVWCNGNEARLLDCPAGVTYRVRYCIYTSPYTWSSPVGVSCNACNQGDIRLTGGENDFEGRVEICYNNVWGTVCDNTWDDADASVVCRQLGLFGNDKPTISAKFGAGAGPIWMDYIHCIGSEARLIDCSSNIVPGYFQTDCYHSNDAGVYCSSISTTESTTEQTSDVTNKQTSELTTEQTSDLTNEQTSRTPTTDFNVSTTLVQRGSNDEEAVPVAELGGAFGTVVVLGLFIFTVTVAVLMVIYILRRRKRRKIQNPQFLRKYTTCTSLPLPEPSNIEKKFCTDDSNKQLETVEDIYEELELHRYEELQGGKSIPKCKAPHKVCRVDTAKNEAYMSHKNVCTKLQTNMDDVTVMGDSTIDKSQNTDKALARALPAAKLALQQTEFDLYVDCGMSSVATSNTISHRKHAEESNGIYEIELEAESDSEVLTNMDTDSVATSNTTSHRKHAEESGGPGIYEMESDAEVFTNVGTTISLAGARADTDINEDPLHTEDDGIYDNDIYILHNIN